jgi:Rod binding domain-containing protein
MNALADLQLSSALSQAKPKLPSGSATNPDQVDKVAKDFEAVFINEIMGAMFEGVSSGGAFGGGPGETIFRSMMIERYSKTIAAQGGFGLAAAVKRELLHVQEKPQ